LTERHFS